jgi:uncharacterized protein YndB with AHSA1/START domain
LGIWNFLTIEPGYNRVNSKRGFMKNYQFEYVIYISATPRAVWNALIDANSTAKYWQHINISDWRPGSRWEHRRSGKKPTLDLIGKVLEFSPPRRLVLSWAFPSDESRKDKHSRVTIEIEPFRRITRLTLKHDMLESGSNMQKGIAEGWPKVLASLKSLMETKHPLPKLW